MSTDVYLQLLATTTGLLLLSGVLQVWGRSTVRAIGLLVLQGIALAGLVLTVGSYEGERAAPLVAALLLVVKALVMPWAMLRSARVIGVTRERSARMKPAVELLGAAGLTLLAYAVSGPILASSPDAAAQAVPVGVSLVLLGFWQILIRSSAITQLVGFLMLDNGIATISFLMSGGLPLVVELGATLDVLLVVLILGVLVVRMQAERGHIDISELRELHD